MSNAWQFLLIDPLVKLLVFLYERVVFQDLGVAIILLTIMIRTILAPLFYRSMRQQSAMRKIQPHVKCIQDKHKHDREAQGKALMALYKEHGVNPFSGIALLFVQLPILIALYQVFLSPPVGLDYSFLGLINLQEPSSILVVIAAFFQYVLGVMSVGKNMPPNDPGAAMMKNMIVIGPLITVVVLYSLPAAVGVYWITTTVYSMAQQAHVNRIYGTHTTSSQKNS